MRDALAQVTAVVGVLARSWANAIRKRQSRGGVVLLPLALAFLALQVWRFGERAARGIGGVLAHAPRDAAVQYASFWLAALLAALTVLKLGRALPARGQVRMFDTPLFRALPLAPAARIACELAVATTHGLSFALLIIVPVVYGVARHASGVATAALATGAVAALALVVTSLVALALQAALARFGALRGAEALRALSFATSFALFMAFVVVGPVTAREVEPPPPVAGAWPLAPVRALVEWLVGAPTDTATVALALAGPVLPAAASITVLAWLARAPSDAITAGPRAPTTARAGDAPGPVAVQLRMIRRQAPALFLAAPGFVLFFAAASWLLAREGGAPREALLAMMGWAIAVGGTAIAGAAARRERRTLGIWLAAAGGHQALVRATAVASLVLLAPLALGPLVLLGPGVSILRAAALVLVAVATLVAAVWTQTGAMFLALDPAPDRLAGLSVAGAFGVMCAALPAAAVLLAAAVAPAAVVGGALALYAATGWVLERAAVARLRWILEPDGDPEAALHAWPALRALGVALIAQVLVGGLLLWLRAPMPAVVVGAYAVFAAVLVPWARRGRRAALAATGAVPRWSRARAVLTGVGCGVLTCATAIAYIRVVPPGTDPNAQPVAGALREADWLWRGAIAAVVALGAPVAEEMLFRGWLQPALAHDLPRRARRWAFVPAAVVFALVHPVAAWVPVGLAGLVSGVLLARGGRLSGSIAMHVTHNTLVLAITLVGRALLGAR